MCIEIHPAINGYEENIKINGEILKGGFLLPSSRKIIIGTFPPYKYEGKDKNIFFYYPGARNHFWNRIDNIFKCEESYKPLKRTKKQNTKESLEENIKRKKIFCQKYGLSFLDCFSEIRRKKVNSSSDKDIIPEKDIIDKYILFKYLDALETKEIFLLFTYKKAFDTIKDKIGNKKIEILEKDDKYSANGKCYYFNYDGKIINMILLYPATRSKENGEEKDKQYKHYLFDI